MAVKVGGIDWDVINTSINNTTDTEVTYSSPVSAFAFKSRNQSTIYWRRTDNSSNYMTFLPGETIPADLARFNSAATQASLGFFRTDNGSGDVLEVIVIL